MTNLRLATTSRSQVGPELAANMINHRKMYLSTCIDRIFSSMERLNDTSSARTSGASSASGRPAPAARTMSDFPVQSPHILARENYHAPLTGAAVADPRLATHSCCMPLLARDAAVDRPYLAGIKRESIPACMQLRAPRPGEHPSMHAAWCSTPNFMMYAQLHTGATVPRGDHLWL